jgi:hypothetical protein
LVPKPGSKKAPGVGPILRLGIAELSIRELHVLPPRALNMPPLMPPNRDRNVGTSVDKNVYNYLIIIIFMDVSG